jgi:hypothetical protein
MPGTMKYLNEVEFKETFADPMQQVEKNAEPPFDFWDYFDHIPKEHFEDHDCSSGRVTYAWTDARRRYQHVLIDSEDKNVFMVLVLDLESSSVYGHRLLDLNKEYGLYDKTVA